MGHQQEDNVHWLMTDIEKVEKTGLKVFSTFSCGGGSSLGYKLSGFSMVGANDIDEMMQRNYVANLHPKSYFLCPVKDLAEDSFALPDELFDLDVLDGSPPCSTFSMAGSREDAWGVEKLFREGQAVQILDDLFFDFLRVANRLQPKVIIAENVKGMLVGNARGYVRAILKTLTAIGYRAQLFLVNAADCGVPQNRERVFFVAIRNDLAETRPPLVFNPRRRRVPVKEALSCVAVPDHEKEWLTPKATHAWDRTLPGKSLGDHFRKTENKAKWFTHSKLSPSEPSCTLMSSSYHTVYRWDEPRQLHVDEFRALSTFPMDYKFSSANIGGYLMGMSVPPFMMRDVSAAVRDQWFLPFSSTT